MEKLHPKLLLMTLFCLFISNKSNAQNYTIIEPGPEHYSSKSLNPENRTTQTLPTKNVSPNNAEQLNKAFNLSGNSNTVTAQPADNCYIPPDNSYLNFPGNDDGSIGPIPLPFTFSLYGINYTSVYINNNGNLTFTGPSGVYDPVGFPYNVPMVAPFWADVDTRVGNTVKYKINPTNLIVTWPAVGYYNLQTNLLNTFQVIISNGNDPLIGLGNNVAFYYGEMQWTTGSASGGAGGFGGFSATAGINQGDGINYIQIGRFNQNNDNYGGPLGGTSGINYLDFSCFPLTAGSLTNLQPAVSGVPANNTLNITCGETGTINLTALPPEVGQNVSVVIDTGGLCNATIVNATSGTSSNATVSIVGSACNEGSHNISFVFTDNFNPSASTTVNITVVIGTAPVISCPSNITVSNTPGLCGANVSFAATATGNLTPTLTYSPESGSFFPVGTTTVTVSATNACGTDTCTFDVIVNDTQPPVVTCPGNKTLATGSNCLVPLPNYVISNNVNLSVRIDSGFSSTTCVDGLFGGAPEPQWGVNINNQGWSIYPQSGICYIGTPNTQYTQTYNCSNDYPSSIQVCFKAFEDDGAACITSEQCLATICQIYSVPAPGTSATYFLSIPSGAPSSGGVTFTISSSGFFTNCPAASDNCSITSVTQSPPPGTLLAPGNHAVTLSAADPSGNTESCTFNVFVFDNTPPIINCPANIMNVEATSPNGAVVNYPTPIGTDNCAGSITTRTAGLASGSIFPIGTTTVTHQVTNPSGVSASCSFTVNVIGLAPQIVCPSNITVSNTPGQCGTNVSFATIETVGIPASTITYSHASGSLFPVGMTTITATATNSVGSSSCTFTVTVNDSEPPTITCAAPVIISNTPGLCSGTTTLTAPVVTDNCAVAPQMTLNGSFASGGDNWNQCGNNVEAYGTEAGYGGSDPFNAVAEIDHEPVSLCQSVSGFVVGQTYQLTFRASRRSGAPPTVGTVITLDGGALNTTVSRSNNIFSLTPETLTFVATQTTHQLTFEPSPGWGGTVGFIIDDISINRQFISNNAPPTFPFGNTIVTWTATDASGNTTTCNQTVTVNDTEAPTIACPANITVNNTANQCGANVSFTATANDNCGTANITYSPASGSFFAVGTTTVTATADDGNGNTASCTFTVTVNDTQPPVINCPGNIEVDMDAGVCGATVSFAATASDNCGTANITYSPASGSFFALGTTTVTATANDGNGNTSSCTFTVTVDLLDHVNLQWPPNATICPGGTFTAYGQVYEPNVTNVNGQQGANIEVQFGYNSSNTNPSTWSNWSPASFNQFGGGPNNDEYYYDFSSNVPGTYYYTFRYRQNGCTWQYGGFQQWDGGTWDGTNYVSGVLTVQSLDWANLQWPPNATICQGSSMTAYGQVYEPGVTPGANAQGAGIDVEFGYSTSNSNPSTWSNWSTASFNQFGGGFANDEYYYNFTPPSSGTYYYTFRYRLNGCSWQYGGFSNPGGYFWDGNNFVSGTVNVSPTTVGGTVSGGTSICPGETSTLLTLSGHTGSILRWESSIFPFLSWDPIANNTTNYTSGPLAETTQFRAVLKSGACLETPSVATTVIVYLTYPFYADNDGDGYGAGPIVMLCSDDANNAPNGYSVDGTDCDDAQEDRHQTFPFFVDADGDGYGAEGSTAVQLCALDGNTPPEPNYSVNDDDCNDLVFEINPGVAEIPFDNIDNNCNGSLYDGHPLIVVNVLSPSCGGINHGLNNTINCTEIYLGPGFVIGYRFKVTNLSTGEVDYVDRVQHHFKLTDTDIYAYGTSYTIQVAAIVNGEVQGYNGSVCTLTTTNVATTKVVNSQCGSTLLFMNSTINANAVNSAITYRFRVARADAPAVYYYTGERNLPNFNLTMLTVPVGFLTYATEYKVDVQIKIKLANIIAWSQFGQVCSIFTPQPPTTSIITSQCELVASSYTQVINATPFAGATLYRFLLTHYDEFGDLDYEQYQDSPTPSFTLSMFTGLQPNTVYSVAVSMQLYGTFVPYDKDCSITTPPSAKGEMEMPFNATVHPNPYTANFMINVKTTNIEAIDIKVYDMVGRLVEQRVVKVNDLENISIGDRYPSGVYNVVVSQGEEVKTLRVVKR